MRQHSSDPKEKRNVLTDARPSRFSTSLHDLHGTPGPGAPLGCAPVSEGSANGQNTDNESFLRRDLDRHSRGVLDALRSWSAGQRSHLPEKHGAGRSDHE